MIERAYWKEKIERAWDKAPIVWLTGVRRVGKTVLSKSFADALYVNCDLPSTSEQLQDPEQFFKALKKGRVVLDEVHQLSDPSRVLKIAADEFPHLQILATGSSTLAATKKFRDSLAGRKRVVHLLPVLLSELAAFRISNLKQRLLKGGLPQALLSAEHDLGFYSEWMDSFFARDIQELFRVAKRDSFLKLLRLLLRQSSGQLEITSVAKMCGLTRPTVMNYLQILQVTHAITILRPYAAGGRREILAQPKVYGFDTGFVSYCRGWEELRNQDCGPLWEHLVLEYLQAIFPIEKIFYWRTKQQEEVDFVLVQGRDKCDVIECKWNVSSFDARGLKAFRARHPGGRNFLVCPGIIRPYSRTFENIEVTCIDATDLRTHLGA